MPEHLIGMFTTNTQTIQIGASALRIISIGFAVSSISVTACGALEGLNMGISISDHFTAPLCDPDHSSCICIEPFSWSGRCMACFWITEWITAAASWYIYRKHAVEKA